MPVLNHEVHPATVQADGAVYGCHNRSRDAAGYYAPDGLQIKAHDNLKYSFVKTRYIKNVLSKECRYDKSLSDPKCSGCCHQGSGEEYDRKVRRDGK